MWWGSDRLHIIRNKLRLLKNIFNERKHWKLCIENISLNDNTIHDFKDANDVTIHDIASDDVTSDDVTSDDVTIHDIASNDITIHDIASNDCTIH